MAESHDFSLDWGAHALLELLCFYGNDFKTVLDVGGGKGEHTRFLKLFGKQASIIDLHEEADYQGDFQSYEFPHKFDAIFCSHVLEHQRNVGMFIERLYDVLADDGILAIAVPCHSRQIMLGGHITNWNAGLLVYNLILGGFDCSEARIFQGVDLNLVMRKKPARGGDILTSSAWTLPTELSQYFPFPVEQGGNCEITQVNWRSDYCLPAIGRPVSLHIRGQAIGDATVDCI